MVAETSFERLSVAPDGRGSPSCMDVQEVPFQTIKSSRESTHAEHLKMRVRYANE